MKRLVLFALAIVSAFALPSAVKAQEFAPLVQPETTSVTRVNLDKLDSSTLTSQAEKIANAALDFFVPDAEQAEEMKQAVPVVKLVLGQYLETYIQPLKDAGVRNFYLIVDKSDAPAEISYPYLAFPTSDLTEDQLSEVRNVMKTINQQVNSVIKYRFVRNNFFFVLITPADDDNEDEIKAYVKKRFSKLNSVEKAEFTEGFEQVDPDAVIATVSVPAFSEEELTNAIAQVSSLLDATDTPFGDEITDALESVGELGAKIQGHVRYVTTSVNLDQLEIVQKTNLKSEESTAEWQKLSNDVIDQIFSTLSQVAEKALSDEDLNEFGVTVEEAQDILSTVEELTRACSATTAEGSAVVWKMNEQFWSDKKPLIKELTEKITALAAKYSVDVDVEDEDVEDSEVEFDDDEDLDADDDLIGE
ncbi:MAG: hypothetical protein ACI4NV_02935 [Thermoguttaceae bacterium]